MTLRNNGVTEKFTDDQLGELWATWLANGRRKHRFNEFTKPAHVLLKKWGIRNYGMWTYRIRQYFNDVENKGIPL